MRLLSLVSILTAITSVVAYDSGIIKIRTPNAENKIRQIIDEQLQRRGIDTHQKSWNAVSQGQLFRRAGQGRGDNWQRKSPSPPRERISAAQEAASTVRRGSVRDRIQALNQQASQMGINQGQRPAGPSRPAQRNPQTGPQGRQTSNPMGPQWSREQSEHRTGTPRQSSLGVPALNPQGPGWSPESRADSSPRSMRGMLDTPSSTPGGSLHTTPAKGSSHTTPEKGSSQTTPEKSPGSGGSIPRTPSRDMLSGPPETPEKSKQWTPLRKEPTESQPMQASGSIPRTQSRGNLAESASSPDRASLLRTPSVDSFAGQNPGQNPSPGGSSIPRTPSKDSLAGPSAARPGSPMRRVSSQEKLTEPPSSPQGEPLSPSSFQTPVRRPGRDAAAYGPDLSPNWQQPSPMAPMKPPKPE